EDSDVALFMKGTPQFVMCGNSDRALQALRRAGASVAAAGILPDPQIPQEPAASPGWPTIPHGFVKGERGGAAAIVAQPQASGELEQLLRHRLGPDYADARDEATVALTA